MKLVGYIRVSTDRQVEDGFGLAVQEKMIRTWCRQQGHTLGDAVYRDEGYSGTLPAPERPALADALSEVEDGTRSDRTVLELAFCHRGSPTQYRHPCLVCRRSYRRPRSSCSPSGSRTRMGGGSSGTTRC
ncbi:recombinase family protein [Streptomyces sp. NPDC056938]|uniref:recombinase family protein n=1 Tax=unclassified Streptomyces TaxID=2593676 RepID=UPI0036452588